MTAVVIIPHYNDPVRLDRCLTALCPQLIPGVQAIVVDNGSDMPLDAVMRAHPDVTFVTETRPGAAMARNRGVAETVVQRLFFLDSDCVPAPDWIAVALRVCTRADIVGGAVAVFDEGPSPRSGAAAFEAVFAFDNRTYIEKQGFSGSGNLLTTRRVFAATGGFRTGLSEDLDWCHRATACGHTLAYADELRVSHPARSDWPALRRKWLRLTEEAWGLRGKGPGARLRWGLRAAAMPASVLVHAPRILRAPRLGGPATRLAALGILTRLRLARCGWMLRQAVSPPPPPPGRH